MAASKERKRPSSGEATSTTKNESGPNSHGSQITSYIFPIIVSLVIIFSIVIGIAYFTSKKDMKNAEAYFVLNQALALNDDSSDENDDEKDAEVRKKTFQEVIESFPKSPAAKDAKFYLAKIDFDQGKFDEAAQRFSEFYELYPDYEPFSTSARLAEAHCFMEKNDFATAKKRFKSIVDEAQSEPVSSGIFETAKYKLALCNFFLGQVDEAKTILNSLLASSADEALEEKVQSFLAKLDIIPPENLRDAILASNESASPESPDDKEHAAPDSASEAADMRSSDNSNNATQDESENPKSEIVKTSEEVSGKEISEIVDPGRSSETKGMAQDTTQSMNSDATDTSEKTPIDASIEHDNSSLSEGGKRAAQDITEELESGASNTSLSDSPKHTLDEVNENENPSQGENSE